MATARDKASLKYHVKPTGAYIAKRWTPQEIRHASLMVACFIRDLGLPEDEEAETLRDTLMMLGLLQPKR